MTGSKKLAQFSFIGFMPKAIITAKKNNVIIKDMRLNEKIDIKSDKPLHFVKKVINKRNPYGGLRYLGGAVGYISYDAVRYWEKLPNIAMNDLCFPNLEMGIFDDGVIFDHVRGEVLYFYWEEDRLDNLIQFTKTSMDIEELSYSNLKANITKSKYEKLVEKAKDYITAGDIFQAVLSKRYEFKIKGNLTKFYLALRKINPSPYMYFLKMGERELIGSSPEMLVRVDQGLIETFPIAGTRPQVEDPKRNKALAEDLLSDPKECAEHVMLLDLARNDIGRVSKFNSMRVPEFMKVHQFSHVQHIVSRVTGKLKDDCDCYDALRAVFPAGTVSGAPKIRAMEIIEELEPTRRGPYAGAVGYFSYNGNTDFAITIRTLLADKEKCYLQAGGGIVNDSLPENEWYETEHKVRVLIKALELSEGLL
jgi:anthranilate synthase component 1